MSDPRAVAESYGAAERARDIGAVMAHVHPDATFQPAGVLLTRSKGRLGLCCGTIRTRT